MSQSVEEISLCPPLRWGLIDSGVYRGGYPLLRNFRFLLRMKLKTIISLTPETPSADLVEFAKVVGIELIHIPIIRVAPINAALQPSSVQAVNICIDKSKHPVFIHCLDGRRISGLVALLIRRLQGWSPVSALAEFWRYQVAIRSPIPSSEVDKTSRELEKFASEIVADVIVPESIPSWLWGGDRSTSVPGIRLKYQPPLSAPPSDTVTATATAAHHNHSSQVLSSSLSSSGASSSAAMTMVAQQAVGQGDELTVPGGGMKGGVIVNEPSKHSNVILVGIGGAGGGRGNNSSSEQQQQQQPMNSARGDSVSGSSSISGLSSSVIPALVGIGGATTGAGVAGTSGSGGGGGGERGGGARNVVESSGANDSSSRQRRDAEKRANTYFEGGAPSRAIQALSLHGLEDLHPPRRGGPMVSIGGRRVPIIRGITGNININNNNSSNPNSSGRSQAAAVETDRNHRR